MQPQLVTCWIGRILIVCILCLTIYVFQSHIKKEFERHEAEQQSSSTTRNIYKRIFEYWSRIVFASCVISSCLLMLSTILAICKHIHTYSAACILFTKMTLTFYQISRLQHCFSQQRINSHSYGYHPCVFIIFYVAGSFVVATIILLQLYTRTVETKFGCILFAIQGTSKVIGIIMLLYFFLWDLGVLIAYIFQIYQLTHHSKDHQTIHKIKIVLQKIVVLTLLFEFSSVFAFYNILLSK
eukprot:UN12582